jgi:hypothetical protein
LGKVKVGKAGTPIDEEPLFSYNAPCPEAGFSSSLYGDKGQDWRLEITKGEPWKTGKKF